MNYNLADDEKHLLNVPPFNIEELDKESILEENIFDYLVLLPEVPEKTRIIEKLKTKARELKVIRPFNSILNQIEQEYANNYEKNNNIINFTNCPVKGLNCGRWIANDSGVYKIDKNSTLIKASPIPILPTSIIYNIDTHTEKVELAFYKRLEWQYIIAERKIIASNTAIIQLANAGIEVNSENAKYLVSYLADVISLNDLEIKKGISHLGWVDNEFVPYTSNYQYDGDSSFKDIYNAVSEKGNYEKWKVEMRKLRKKSKTLCFMMASSFASPLVNQFQINSFIVHLFGKSGTGKTLTEMVCASIWGNPSKKHLLRTLDNTEVASELLCSFFRNLPLIYDEYQISKDKYTNFDKMIYKLTEGKGRDRGTELCNIRETTLWDNIIILSGEEPITSQSSKEGVKNRVIEIEENQKIIENGEEVVKLISDNYGFAGKEFIKLIQNRDDLYDIYNNYVKELQEYSNYSKQINAIATILVADKIVSEIIFEDEPITLEEAKNYFSNDTDEADRCIDIILDYANSHINNFCEHGKEYEKEHGKLFGDYEKDGDYIKYFNFIPSILRKHLSENNINFDGIKKNLAEKGYLIFTETHKKREYTITQRVNGISQRIVKIRNIR